MNQKETTKKDQQEPSVIELKAAVYDKMSEMEMLNLRMQELQKEVQQINAQIQEKIKKEKGANAV